MTQSVILLDIVNSRSLKSADPAFFLEFVEKMLQKKFLVPSHWIQISRGDSLQCLVPVSLGIRAVFYIVSLLKIFDLNCRIVIGEGVNAPPKTSVEKIHNDPVLISVGDTLDGMKKSDFFRIIRRENNDINNSFLISRYIELLIKGLKSDSAGTLILALEGYSQSEISLYLKEIEGKEIGQPSISERLKRVQYKRILEVFSWWNLETKTSEEKSTMNKNLITLLKDVHNARPC